MKGYVRFKSQSQQKWISGCWADNAKKGVLAFQGRVDAACAACLTKQHIVRGTAVKRQHNYSSLDLESIKGMFWWGGGSTRQISSVVWDSVQALELSRDWITGRILKLVFESISTISLCP